MQGKTYFIISDQKEELKELKNCCANDNLCIRVMKCLLHHSLGSFHIATTIQEKNDVDDKWEGGGREEEREMQEGEGGEEGARDGEPIACFEKT